MTTSQAVRVVLRAVFAVLAIAALVATPAAHAGSVEYILTVTKAGSGSGTVTSNIGAVDCGMATCSDMVGGGSAVVLTATPAGASQFTGWLGPCTGSGTCNFTISGATTAVATFAPTTIGPPALDIDGNFSYDALTDGLLVLRYLFGLSGTALTNNALGTGATRNNPTLVGNYLADIRPILDIDGNGQVDALTDGLMIIRYLFGLRGASLIAGAVGEGATRAAAGDIETQIQSLSSAPAATQLLSVSIIGTGTGAVTSTPAGINCSVDCAEPYNESSVVTLTPAPGPDSTFSGWGGACAGTGGCMVTMDTGKSVSAAFTLNTLVPPLPDPSVATSTFGATAFLYTGANPIQTGVVPGTIEDRRAAVLRGGVRDSIGGPLPGVAITVLAHPEFGQTLSRADGRFDLAVNGGGMLTLNYAKSGYLPVQRQVNVPWQDYAVLPDIVMIVPDSQVTTIDLNSPLPIQVAQASPVTDADGSRQATLLFAAGTQATLVMPDGSTQPLTTLNVRATEYTVGPNGPARMPAALPPTSAYTYAVELNADEAIAAGARSITFNQPLFHYVENFLAFPVGMIVPTGYYDRDRAAWVPAENGRVIRITSVSGGAAIVDTVGTGGLPPLTLSTEERQQLALLYPVGQELWRVPINHFTPWDMNWPYGPPPDAIVPPAELTETYEPVDDPCTQTGSSIIQCENQILGEAIGVIGTRFKLHYQSDRVPAWKAAFTLDVPLTGSQPPASLSSIELEILVAGRKFAQTFSAAPDQRHTFTWDGYDAYGRQVQGAAKATVRLGYVYNAARYQQPAQFAQSFAAFSGILLPSNLLRREITIWQESQRTLGVLPTQVGGWSLSQHHAYDPTGKVLYRGDGSRRDAQSISAVMSTVAGTGVIGFSGNGGPATQAAMRFPVSVAVAPNGSFYIADANDNRIRRVAPDGIITTAAGTGVAGFSGDGGQAIQAKLDNPRHVAVAADGSVFIVDGNNHRIRRVGPDGIITTVAGSATAGFGGDGGPATQAAMLFPSSIAVAPDGSLLIVDKGNLRIRQVGSDGIINTIAGTGTQGVTGDGGPATQARLESPNAVALAPDGSFYIAEVTRIRRVGPDGIINTVAGTGTQGFSGDGGPATLAKLNFVLGAAAAPDGSVYLADGNNSRIRRIGPDGIINTVAGSALFGGGLSGDGGPATQARLNNPNAVALAPDGSLYVAEGNGSHIRRVTDPLPGFSATDIVIPSEDGSALYKFNGSGRHLQTLHALTGAVLYQFTYDPNGRLTGVTDGDGNVTTIQRDGSGNPTAIVGPFGQTTGLSVNSSGYLSQITSPAGENVQLAYTTGGLLTSLNNPRGHVSSYIFDALGRLTSATDPTGAVKTMARSGTNKDNTVTITTALGRVTTYRAERLSNGDKRRTTTDPAGKQTQVVNGRNGNQNATYPDGTTVSAVLGPDPRWGMQAPLATSVIVTTPGGKVHTTTTQRTVTLTTPTNPLSLATLTETRTINGRAFVRAYTAATRTLTTTSPIGRQKTTVVDLLGKPVQAQFGGLAASSFTYDPTGRLAGATQGSGGGSRTTTLAYGVNGFLQSATDPASRTLAFARDVNGRTTELTFPDGGQSHFAYDANGNITTIVPPGRPDHLFAFTQNNQVSTYTAPVAGAQNSQTQYAYNADRQPLQVGRPDGQSAALQYDSAGRTSLVDMALGDTLYAYDAAGRLASLARDQGVALAFAYDGGLATGMTWSGPVAGSVTRILDNNFRLTSLSVNGSDPVALAYDLDGLPVQVGALTLTRSAQNGLITGTVLGTVSDTLTYDIFGDPASHTASQGGGAVYATTYTRDSLGRIATRSETIDGITRAFAYTYDLSGRLVEVRQDGILTASYTYDGNGNRLSRTGGGTTTATYDAQDRLEQFGTTTYLHNAAGERLSKTAAGQTTSYQYDTFGNMTGATLPGATQIDYLLDGGQRRVGRKVNGALVQGFLYQDGLKPIAELDGANNVVSRFVYSTGVNVPAYLIKAGVTYRVLTDHLGSPRLVIDAATGSIAQRLDYDEFGKVILDTNPGFQPFGFAGGLHDPLTGLVHYGAREYDPDTGRWTAKDPIGFRAGDGNLYGYVLGDPVNRADPRGLLFGDLLNALLKPVPIGAWGAPCPPGSDDTPGEGKVRDALGNLIDSQVDSGIENIVGGGKFMGPVGTALDAATVAAQGFIIVHEAPREQRDLIDTILTGSTDEQDYARRKYFSPNRPTPCPSNGGPCGR